MKLKGTVMNLFFVLITLTSTAFGSSYVPEEKCREEYVSELHDLLDNYENGEGSVAARKTLEKMWKRMRRGGLVGWGVGAVAATLFFAREKTNFEPKGLSVPTGIAVGAIGYIPGLWLGNVIARKETKTNEKSAAKYLLTLFDAYSNMSKGFGLITSSVVVVEKNKYTPDETRTHSYNLREFIYQKKIDLTVEEVATKIYEADQSKVLCADYPYDSEKIAEWLKQ